MKLEWTRPSQNDVRRIHAYISAYADDTAVADTVVAAFNQATKRLLDHPKIGARVERASFRGREVRRLLVGSQEIMYEVTPSTIYILRICHERESR